MTKKLNDLYAWLGLTQEDVELKKRASHAPSVKRPASPDDIDAMIRAAKLAEEEEARAIRERAAAAVKRTFTPGAYYMISRSRQKLPVSIHSRNDVEEGYVFRYLRKEGPHHMFQEVVGGWLRTYTDAQLVGKFVDEVRLEDVMVPVNGGFRYA